MSKQKRKKQMSQKTLEDAINLRKTLLTQKYLSSVVARIEDVEKNSTIASFVRYAEAPDLKKIVSDLDNDEDKVDVAMELMHSISELFNGDEMKHIINETRKVMYDKYNPTRDIISPTKKVKLALVKTIRALTFRINLNENWDVDVTYPLTLQYDDADIERLYDEWDVKTDTVPMKSLAKYEFKIHPIDKFYISVRQHDKNSSVKQGYVMKNTHSVNRIVITKI